MAEENPIHQEATSHDDVSVLRVLLHTVKGLSPVSVAPTLEMATSGDEQAYPEQFEFER